MAVLSYLIPSGRFERTIREVNGIRQTVVIPNSFKEVPKEVTLQGVLIGSKVDEDTAIPASLLGLFTSIPKGMQQSAGLIFFVFIIGAVFMVIQETGTVEAVIHYLLEAFNNSPVLTPAVLLTFFAMATTFLSMGYEYIPLVPLMVLVAQRLGFDSMFGVAIITMGQGIGWGSGVTSPLNTQVAQLVAQVPLDSGLVFRLVFFLILLGAGVYYILNYGRTIRRNPSRSLMGDMLPDGTVCQMKKVPLKKEHVLILLMAMVLFAAILYAVQTMGWGVTEMSGGFLAVGIFTIFLGRLPGSVAMEAMTRGLAAMIVPALIIGVARAIQVILFEAEIVDTLLYYASEFLKDQHGLVALEGMFVFQSILNFFIPSASGQALVTMPLLVPLSDILSIPRTDTVFAFVIGDGLTNLIIPTNGYLLAILGVAGIPFEKWFRFIIRFYLFSALLGALFLAFSYYTR